MKKLTAHLQNESVIQYIPFAAGLAAVAAVFLLIKFSKEKTVPKQKQHEQKPDVPEKLPEQKPDLQPAGEKPGESPEIRAGIFSNLKNIVSGAKISGKMWDEFEEMLVLADTGVRAAAEIRERVERRLSDEESRDYGKIKNALVEEILEIVKKAAPPEPDPATASGVKVYMLVGVNGTGKTTTAGKLSNLIKNKGGKVMLAAADTFRAAAGEQLEKWAAKTGSEFIRANAGADPGALAFDAVKSAEAKNCDALIIDTAGRLHTKTNLMDELARIKKVIGKAKSGAPHEIFLVVDATTGQNGLRQAEMFDEAVGLTGIVLTKIDGTAKGGIAVAIARQFEIPVVYTGTGEGRGDISGFDPDGFVSGFFD